MIYNLITNINKPEKSEFSVIAFILFWYKMGINLEGTS